MEKACFSRKLVSLLCVVVMLITSLVPAFNVYAASGETNCVKAVLKQTWGNLINQAVQVSSQTSYKASFWAKGSGQVAMVIKKGDWSGEITGQMFTINSENWTEYSYTFNSGANDNVNFQLADCSTGTVYIDDCFLGVANGTNLLTNGTFAEGTTSWGGFNTDYTIDATEGRIGGNSGDSGNTGDGGTPPVLDPNGLVDELSAMDAVYETSIGSNGSANIGIDSSNANMFMGDTGRLCGGRTVTEAAYVIYKTEYDINSFSADVFYWNSSFNDITVDVSSDGLSYTPVTLDKYDLGGDWDRKVFCSYEMPVEGVRYIKFSLPKTKTQEEADNYGWGVQIGRIVLNNKTAPVVATPGTGKLEDSQAVSLSCATTGAAIYYFTDSDTEPQLYTNPITITGYTILYAYATQQGKEDSITVPYTYFTEAQETVDKYGQLKSADFPAKVTSDQQLLDDKAVDAAYYSSLTPPTNWDVYGGLSGSKEQYGLEATGFFHIEKIDNDSKFVMVDPLGNLFFSVGVNGVGYYGDTHTDVSGREYQYNWIPQNTTDESNPDSIYQKAFLNGQSRYFSYYVANKVRKDGAFNEGAYYQEQVERLKKWGFNSEGGFSDVPDTGISNTMSQTRHIDLPTDDMIPGLGLIDIYKDGEAQRIYNSFANTGIAEDVDDPNIIGYYFGNEFQYQNFQSGIVTKKASEVATKGALVEFLKTKYNNDITAYNAAWENSFESFDQMNESSIDIKTSSAQSDMNEFMEQYLDKIYKTVHDEFKKLDDKHMLLGDRYLKNTMDNPTVRELVSEAAGKYMDVLSYNYYTPGIDLDRIIAMAQKANKPLMFTEFMYTEPSQGQTGGVEKVQTEEQKGKAYSNYVEKAAASGVVVGAHWFEYLDQAVTGRWFQGYEGESFACGLLNVADKPYKTMLEYMMKTNYGIYDVVLGKKAPASYDYGQIGGERYSTGKVNIGRAASSITIDGVKDEIWPYSQVIHMDDSYHSRVNGTQNDKISADISLAWDDTNLYLFAHMKDDTPMQNAFDGSGIWNGDAVELFVGPEAVTEGGALKTSDTQIIISSGGLYYWYNGKAAQPVIDTAVLMDSDEKGYAIEAAIPLSGLNITSTAVDQKFRIDLGFDNGIGSNRVSQYIWNGGADNNANRTGWGTATLVEQVSPSDVTLAAILGRTVTGSAQAGTSDDPFQATVNVANTVTSIAGSDITTNDPDTRVVFYGTDSSFASAITGSVNLEGTSTSIYFKLLGADNTIKYYKITIVKTTDNGHQTGGYTYSNNSQNGSVTVSNGNVISADVSAQVDPVTKTAAVSIDAGLAAELAAKAKSAEASGKSAVIELKVAGTSGATALIISIPRDAVNQITDGTNATLKLNTGLETVTFDAVAFKSVAGSSSAVDISISIKKIDNSTLTGEAKSKVGDRPVYNFSVKAGTDTISGFGGGKVQISLNYAPKAGEKYNSIVVYYIDDSGKVKTIRGKYNPATGTVDFVTTHFSEYAIGYNEVSFSDVDASSRYNTAISFIAARGITYGTGNGKFDPDNNIKRADFLVMVMNAYGIDADSTITDNFADAGSKYYSSYLATAKKLGLVSGVGNNRFAPEVTISHQDMLVILYNVLKKIGELPTGTSGRSLDSFSDSADVSDYAKAAMKLFVEIGAASGNGKSLAPRATSTRAQVAQVLYNLLSI